MKVIKPFLLLFLITELSFGQTKLNIEDVFKRYLISEDESIGKTIINSKDGTYSLFCQAALAEDLNEKINFYTKFIQLNPKYGLAKAYLNRGIVYEQTEKYDSSIVDCTKSIEIEAKDPYSYYFRGASYASLEKYDKAIEDYSRAISIQPNFALAYHMRGISHFDRKDYKSSVADFTKVIELDKNYDLAFLMRGINYEEMGEYKNAISDWKVAKKINKENSKNVDVLIEKANKKMKDKK